jgi:hypothetical protein
VSRATAALALVLSTVLVGGLVAAQDQRRDDATAAAAEVAVAETAANAETAETVVSPVPLPVVTTTRPPVVTTPPRAPVTTPQPAPVTVPPAARSTAAYGPVAMPTCPKPPPGSTAPRTKVPIVAEAAVPAPVAAPRPAGDLAALRGRSVWITPFTASGVDVAGIVRRSRQAGLTAIWVRTGGSRQGYYGDALLRRLVPAAHAAGLKVIAWDFPFLSDPLVDVERARRALAFRVDGQGIDAFSPDLETTAEGTFATPRRVASYLSRVRVLAGGRAVVSTVPRPTDKNVRAFPYAAQAPYVDAFAAMVYWSCKEPGATAVQAVERLARLGRAVHVVGQGYDMGSEGGRRGLPRAAETLRFLDASRRAGAIGGSLWTAERFGPGQWGPLGTYAW